MKIALVYPHSIIPVPHVRVFDALAVVNYEMARRLAKDHDVIVYTRRGPDDKRLEFHERVTYRRVRVGIDRALNSLGVLDKLGIASPKRPFRLRTLYYLPYLLRVALDLRKRRPDVIHIQGPSSFIPILRFFNPRAAIVLHSHDHALADFDRDLLLGRLRQVALILGCSAHIVEAIRKRFPEVAERCHVMYNGVDARFLEVESRPQESREVLFIGRLSPEKGVHVLLDAFAKILPRFPDARLRLAGPLEISPKQFVDPWDRDPLLNEWSEAFRDAQSYQRELERRAKRLGNSVTFEGAVANHELPALHALAGVFVFPSVWQEPFGIPPIEAMAAGLPVVGAESGAIPEIVDDGITGTLVPRGDADALADAIATLLEDPGLRARMGVAGRQRVANRFTWDGNVAGLIELYRRYCAPPGPAREDAQGRSGGSAP